MNRIGKEDWSHLNDLACEILHLSAGKESNLIRAKIGVLMGYLNDLEEKYGPCSRITGARADFVESPKDRLALYKMALHQAKLEGDTENEEQVREALVACLTDAL